MRPAFIVTIDTEGDDLWSRPSHPRTRNAAFLRRFQELCEEFGLKPTYLTNWEMAHSPVFRDLGMEALQRNAAEIGMHLHAWDSPPIVPLTENDNRHHPYLVEFPESVMREKIGVLTRALRANFGIDPRSHRAGRWGFDERYARVLSESGYRVDCSVTPHCSWQSMKGDPDGRGGTDYRGFPDSAYFVDLDDISVAGDAPLLEVPVTVRVRPARLGADKLKSVIQHVPLMRRLLHGVSWLRPNGRNRQGMLDIAKDSVAEGRDYVEFTLHSSELMPGGSPTFPTPSSIERLYDDLRALFQFAGLRFDGLTLTEYYQRYARSQAGDCVQEPRSATHSAS